jgi:phage terminase large subunit-like protein
VATASLPDPVTQYARDVVGGTIVAGRLVRLACARHLHDLEHGHKRGLKWDLKAVHHVLKFFSFLRFSDGAFEGKPFIPQPFQAFIIGSIFGWKNADGYRRYRTGYVERGKGSGKTPEAAAIGLYCMIADGEGSAECFSAATAQHQAAICFRDAKLFAQNSPSLSNRITIGQANLGYEAKNSFFRPVSAEHRGLDGKRPHCAIVDELHEHPNDLVVEKMRAGTKGRRQAIQYEITNSGHDRTSVCWAHREYSVKILEGFDQDDGAKDDAWFAYVCQLDACEVCRNEGKTMPTDGCSECDQWDDEKVWIKANPGLGTILPIEYLRGQVREAKGMPSKENLVKRLNFCCWCVTPNTLITMANGGRKRADQLQIGDRIIAFDEAIGSLVITTVKAVADNGVQSVFKITTARGRVITVTGNHRFWSRYGRTDNPKYGWVEAEKLQPGSRVAVALGGAETESQSAMDRSEAYLLGAMAGDGTCRLKNLRFTNREPALVAACNEIMKPHGCEFATQPNGKYHHHRNIVRQPWGSGSWLKRLLLKHRMSGKNCYNKRVPEQVMTGGPEAWEGFLSGYLDTDGYVLKGIVAWCSINHDLLSDCQHLLALLGVQSSLNSVDNEKCREPFWRLEVRDKRSLSVLVHLLKPSHPHKARKLTQLDLVNYRCGNGPCPQDVSKFDRIVSVEQLPPTQTLGIEVNDVHTHVTNGFITHNTATETRAIPMDKWDCCKRDVDYAKLLGRDCYGGLDIGATSDFTAFSLVFPHDDVEHVEVPIDIREPQGHKRSLARRSFTLLSWFWLPEHPRKRGERETRQIDTWRRMGLVRTTPGEVVDYDLVLEDIVAICSDYSLCCIGFDRGFQGSQMGNNLLNHYGERMVREFPQGIISMNAPFREFLELIILGRLHHDGNAVLRWMASNTAAEIRGGLMKPSKDKSAEKIDGIVSAVMGLGVAMVGDGETSWYTPGVLSN